MSNMNLNSGYGQAQVSNAPYTTGRLFVVASSTDANFDDIDRLYQNQYDGVVTRHGTMVSALAACVADRWDVIVLSPDFTTALSAAELLAAETKGVKIEVAWTPSSWIVTVERATWVLAQTADLSIFTVTGRVELISIIWEVTTVVETQANATLLKINPTVGADVDLCAALDISADAVGSQYTITGTVADALINTVSGAGLFQASSLIVTAWVIELECAASNTWSVKFQVQYRAIDAWARIIAA